MPKITIDDREVEARDGENLIDAAARIGVNIPHFCYHPGLSVAGNCRQCLVELDGNAKPQIACNLPLKDGMKIRCTTPAIQEARRGVLEFLLLNHPIDCPVCDQAGECRLQEYYMGHGLYDARRNVDKVHKPKVVDLGPLVVLDAERCVLCTRCVRFCQEVAGTEELYVKERGHHAEIVTFPGMQLDNPYSGNVIDVCPVGALLNRQFRFQSRVWWLKQADNVCSSCARGCNIRVDHHWNKVQRLVPRPNPDVNKYWMCDRGRMNFQSYNDNRLVDARVGGQDSTLRDAIDTLCTRLTGAAGEVAVLLSPKLANEELLVLRRLFGDLLRVKVLGAGSLEPDQPEDDILRRADPHPNSFAVNMLGLQGDVRKIVRESQARVLVIVGDDPVGWDPSLAETFARYETVAAWLTNSNATAQAVDAAGGILMPLATHFEFAGSFTNFEGRVQAFEPALASPGSAMAAYDLGIELAHTLGLAFWPRAEHPALVLEAIWSELLPDGVALAAPAWGRVPQNELVATPRPTAQSTTKGYAPSGTV